MIPRSTLHRQIHERIKNVPVPKTINAINALAQLRKLEEQGAISEQDSLLKRLKVLIALFDCIEQPTADALKAQLEVAREFYKKSP